MTYSYTDISLGEYPGEVSLIIYTGSCVCACPWCFNPLLLNKKPLSYKQMKDVIDEHLGFITSVVFSGGEPLMNPFLIKIIKYAKDRGLKVKLNTNGLVHKNVRKNIFIPYVDYMNISIKGLPSDYQKVLKSSKVFSVVPHCNVLEYSFVYIPTLWTKKRIDELHTFLKETISYDWRAAFSSNWSRPDIFTVKQMRVGDCLDSQYNGCRVPDEKECIYIAKLFSDIPSRKVRIETREFGRKGI